LYAAAVLVCAVLTLAVMAGANPAAVYNIYVDEDGSVGIGAVEVELPETSTTEDLAAALMDALFDRANSPNFAPPGTRVLTLIVNNGHITLNLSREVRSFGEEYYTNILRPQIAETLLAVPEIDVVTILVDNDDFYRVMRPLNVL